MSFDLAYKALGWPSRDEILNPNGAGAKYLVELARQKLGKSISQLPNGGGVEVGILASDPDTTEAPLAIICEFPRTVPDETLFGAQKLAWNFCRSSLLITVEPTLIRKWSCFETPVQSGDAASPIHSETLDLEDNQTAAFKTPEILPSIGFDSNGVFLDEKAAEDLQWIDLVSGYFFQKEAIRFPQEKRADRMLLSNLKVVRSRLRMLGLEDRFSHDLLARIIFVQFLFHRKDATNVSALSADKLRELHDLGVLSGLYSELPDLLSHYEDTYRLFQWLNERFNGDLFPGKGETPEAQEAEWQEEKRHVNPDHLKLLAHFVQGDLEMKSEQKCLWRLYAFDAIPLEFISSIYEEFVNRKEGTGIHYTPGHLVDLMLDRVLPWDCEDWNLKILDPSCGSGIFLVKAYQRLIYRWKFAHRFDGAEIGIRTLHDLLNHNIFGVDKDPNAVRVASFSLYLAMCDEIDPRHYWSDKERVRFPVLRSRRIVHGDFFSENGIGYRTVEDAGTYDLVIGNPPWGDTTIGDSVHAVTWATRHKWNVANKDFGILFVVKSAGLVKEGGHVCLVQSASALLYNREVTAVRLRKRIFLEFKTIEGVISLSAFRLLDLFKDAIVPACVLIIRNDDSTGEGFWYECPKPRHTNEDLSRISFESQDAHFLFPRDVETEPWIWSLYMWGANRDRNFIRKLSPNPSIQKLMDQKLVQSRQGVIRGDRGKQQKAIVNRKYFDAVDFPPDHGLYLRASDLKVNTDPDTDSAASTDFSAFALPQLIIKLGWLKSRKRIQARLVDSGVEKDGVICSSSYITVHSEPGNSTYLQSACLSYNSSFAAYFLLLTSGRFAFYRPEVLVKEMRSVPLPDFEGVGEINLSKVTSLEMVDESVYRLYGFNEAEKILIEDLFRYTLPDYQGDANSPGRRITQRMNRETEVEEPEMRSYIDIFCRVLRAAYGNDKSIGATIYHEQDNSLLPVRMVSIHLNNSELVGDHVVPLASRLLRDRLVTLYDSLMNGERRNSVYQRSCRCYESIITSSGQTSIVVHLIKPDQMSYWTRSAALKDADAIAADFMKWQASSQHAKQIPKVTNSEVKSD